MTHTTHTTLQHVKSNGEISGLIAMGNRMLEAKGYTEHGKRHMNYVSRTAADILAKLAYPERDQELAAIAGWVHDVGNAINREHHGISGAALLYPILVNMRMPLEDLLVIIGAVGNHEEHTGCVASPVSAALVIADKTDVHKSRVRAGQYDPGDIHDRVNFATQESRIDVDDAVKLISYKVTMAESSNAMEFLEIYHSRIRMSEEAAKFLGCRFKLSVNGLEIN